MELHNKQKKKISYKIQSKGEEKQFEKQNRLLGHQLRKKILLLSSF